MLDCLIVGDSIAVGTHQFKQECRMVAKGGINSYQWVNMYHNQPNMSAETVIISLGTNDHKYIKTEAELNNVRALVQGKRVFWILPVGNNPKSGVSIEEIQRIVKKVAEEHGDVVLPITSTQADKIHPNWAGYKQIAKETE
jgi:lysophospholipase L1-like esterase